MNYQEAHLKAKKKAESKIGFRIHLTIYIVVITLLVIINLSTSTEYIWFKWPLLGWGVAVIIHALSIFNTSEQTTIKERMIKKEIEKETLRNQ